MSTQKLINGYTNYTTPSALSAAVAEDAPAISPTATVTTSSQACITTISMTATATIDNGC
ncbi:LxmA leader domain family RiPP [Corynebacterium propinquum]